MEMDTPMTKPQSPKFHIAMVPWFAFGHMTPYLHLANGLAERGHKITFFLPTKAQSQLQTLNRHTTLISFHPLAIPHVDGLPPGAETASDLHISLHHLIITAFDQTADQVEVALQASKPDFLLHDSFRPAPALASKLGIKAINYTALSASSIAINAVPACAISKDGPITEAELAIPPPGYPSSTVVYRGPEVQSCLSFYARHGDGISLFERFVTTTKESDAIALRTCREIEGKYCDYIGTQFGKPVFLTGPILPESSPVSSLEERWAQWLGGFNPGSVIFCAFGSQHILEKDQFQEVILGLEQTGLPFLAALKPPTGAVTIEDALPERFQERVGGRGVVYGGWVQQPSILSHPSVGCFVNHCGFGTMLESLINDCQIVLVPHLGDQIMNSRVLAEELKVAVEVEKEENGWVSKESLCEAIKSVMDEDSEMGCLVRKNHAQWKETLTSPGFRSNYVDRFVSQLQGLLHQG